jgi:hypothetical protein
MRGSFYGRRYRKTSGSTVQDELISTRAAASRIVCCTIAALHLSACFRYQVAHSSVDRFTELQGQRADYQKYCRELEYDFYSNRIAYPQPEQYIEFGRCIESGYTIQNTELIQEVARNPLALYRASAQCEFVPAIEKLRSLGEALPEPGGCRAGTFFFPCLKLERCGHSGGFTPLGYVLTAPITIPVGAVLLAGALLTLPVCVVIAPFVGGRCM